MKNIFDLLRQKEDALKQLQAEVDALRLAARLLADDDQQAPKSPEVMPKPAPVPRTTAPAVPARAVAPGNGGYSAAWGNAPRQFP
jgi:hypothetical protein